MSEAEKNMLIKEFADLARPTLEGMGLTAEELARLAVAVTNAELMGLAGRDDELRT